MAARLKQALSLLCFSFLLACPTASSVEVHDRRAYIIHMDTSTMPSPFVTHKDWYSSVLSSLSRNTSKDTPEHLYTYTHVMHGFSAVLNTQQLQQLEQLPGHLATFPDSFAKIHTTHTPQFLGLASNAGLWPISNFGDGAIVGVIDTGVWPESKSFNDKGMPPIPPRWRGGCESGAAFNSSLCNRKLIGARYFSKGLKHQGLNISSSDYDSPRDSYGHGTHTASTAVGRPVARASYFGYAKGTATGIAPNARVATYKAIFTGDVIKSAATDVLAAMDRAIDDGVDILSLSLAFHEQNYFHDVIALGAFAAMEKGIFVACSAGNDGPDTYSIVNGAPWITTVGAGTVDRDFSATITLGGGLKIQGKSIYAASSMISNATLYYGRGNKSKETCDLFALERKDVAKKVVFCSAGNEILNQIGEARRNGARGVIAATTMEAYLSAGDFFSPLVAVSPRDGESIKRFAQMRDQTVSIQFKTTVLGVKPAPRVAYFSSRGPSRMSPGLLKPDIVAPGVDILAAWVPNKAVMEIGPKKLYTSFKLDSGTSMSSPHVAGVAALLRSIHKDWSPAAIRSAMVTTATISDNTGNQITDVVNGTTATPLDFGGGHVNPNKAMDPGLVYDAGREDYINFLCGLNYTHQQIMIIVRSHNFTCKGASLDLNYPSFTIILNNTQSAIKTFKRTLTNVADQASSYKAVMEVPEGMKVKVMPQQLTFSSKGSKQGFEVTVEIDFTGHNGKTNDSKGTYGFLKWAEVGGKHVVSSPLVAAFAFSNS